MSRLLTGLQILLVLMCFTGMKVKARSLKEANPADHCLELMTFNEQLESIIQLEDTELRDLFCKNATRFFNCMNDMFVEQTGFTMKELADNWFLKITDAGKYLTALVRMEEYVTETCRNGSGLDMDHMMDKQCFERGYPYGVSIKHCKKQTLIAYLIFRELEPERELSEADNECIGTAYQFGCIASTLREECGFDAFTRYTALIRRIRFFRSGKCSADIMQVMKTTFLESLDMSESRKNVYRTILELRRRKK